MFPVSAHKNQIPCKCCSSEATLYGVCDFTKSCQEVDGNFAPLSGIPVYYYKCLNCGFIFTIDFDVLTIEEIKNYIYNEEYVEVDPDYTLIRPKQNARMLWDIFSRFRDDIRILDYGGGNGALETHLREMGFKKVVTYDGFDTEYVEKPTGLFNLIAAFEVVEHVSDPYETFKEMSSLLDVNNGMMMFSTIPLPDAIDKVRTGWWYIAPRNGHISIHTSKSINLLLNRLGLNYTPKKQIIHFAYKTVPGFARHILE